MKKFKYKVFDLDKLEGDETESEFLNIMGAMGWELIFINNEPMMDGRLIQIKLYFKKEIL